MNVYVAEHVLSFVDDYITRFECGSVCWRWYKRMIKPFSFVGASITNLRQMVRRNVYMFIYLVEGDYIKINDYDDDEVLAVADAAAECGCLKLVRMLIKNRYDLAYWYNTKCKTENFGNILFTAVKHGYTDIVKLLLKKGHRIGSYVICEAMEIAADNDDQELFELLSTNEDMDIEGLIKVLYHVTGSRPEKYMQIIVDDERLAKQRKYADWQVHDNNLQSISYYLIDRVMFDYYGP